MVRLLWVQQLEQGFPFLLQPEILGLLQQILYRQHRGALNQRIINGKRNRWVDLCLERDAQQ